RNAHAELNQRRGGDQVFLDHLPDEPQVARVKDLELRFDTQIAQNPCALAQVVGCRDVSAVAIAKIETAAVEGGDVGAVEPFVAEVDDMPHAIFLAAEVRAGCGRIFQPVVADTDIATHSAGEVDDHVDLAFADALDYVAVVSRLHAERACLRVAHVDVNDGRASLRSLNGCIGNLLRRDRAVRAFGDLGIVTGDGARDDDI